MIAKGMFVRGNAAQSAAQLQAHLLADPDIRVVTETNEIDFVAKNDEVIAFYLYVPRKATRRLKPLLAILSMQLFSDWERRGTFSKACYLDEFTKLGQCQAWLIF